MDWGYKACQLNNISRLQVVALDGTIINKAGIITGGFNTGLEARAGQWDQGALDELKQASRCLCRGGWLGWQEPGGQVGGDRRCQPLALQHHARCPGLLHAAHHRGRQPI